ncbi:16S rRNA (uracil(1498)-N(3))-methyltransferase [Candidatus Poribacteria bacterium]|nr:16S rRNA (uracil(1498)-N(3))-methyltransferase [Candidatus Poribacteria bacterium]
MHSCYVPPAQISEDTIRINESERHHLLNVLRLRAGDHVEIFDGEGNHYIASLHDTRTSPLQAKILQHQFHPHTPPYITLFQGLPKFDKMDLIVQKTTEIGVNEIAPMICERSIPKAVVQQKRTVRWQRIANEAAKQCKRAHFAHVFAPQRLEECLGRVVDLDLLILLWEGEKRQGLKETLRNHGEAKSVGLFVGPEGGFSDKEVKLAVQNGCIPATFGDNILRTETAAIVSVASVMYELK